MTNKRKYNHAVSLFFEVVSADPDGEDFTPAMLKEALLQRVVNLDVNGDWVEAIGLPSDTYVEEN